MALFLTRGDDVVRSSGLPVAVWSGAGDDRITTRGGDDAIFADGGGNISFLGGPGSIGSGGADVVSTGPGNDRVETGAGRDTVRSGSGDDRVQSGAGRDTILTGPGADDVLELGRGADVIDAGLGKDVVDDVLAGRPGESVTTGPREPSRPDWLLVNARRPVTWDMAAAVAVVRGVTITLAAARTNDVSGRRWVVSGTDQGEYLGALTGRPAEFRGLGGPDRFSGNFDLADLFDGGDGEDTYVSGEKRNNTCISVEHDPGPSCKP
jgi:Ca2+-binding RTX toxin-like protein